MWRAYKAAGRPWPEFDPDEVIDYLITEAIAAKAAQEDAEAARKEKIQNWKKDTTELEKFREP